MKKRLSFPNMKMGETKFLGLLLVSVAFVFVVLGPVVEGVEELRAHLIGEWVGLVGHEGGVVTRVARVLAGHV